MFFSNTENRLDLLPAGFVRLLLFLEASAASYRGHCARLSTIALACVDPAFEPGSPSLDGTWEGKWILFIADLENSTIPLDNNIQGP